MTERSAASVFTHRRPRETRPAFEALREAALAAGVELRLDAAETAKLSLSAQRGLSLGASQAALDDVQICFALGGDGTILTSLRRYADTSVPVFGVNFGAIGFLAAVEREEALAGFERAFAGDFEVLEMPALAVAGLRPPLAINDVTIHRQPGKRVANLAYSVARQEIGRVHCDGLVVSTPAGSTGYNLANGGPVMAWGVEGFAVSFIAPHSLNARSLVVAPDDVLSVRNRSEEEPVDVEIDGRPVAVLQPGAMLEVGFGKGRARLAQLPGATFYERLREKFGRLTTVP